jgi:hypothetical protein
MTRSSLFILFLSEFLLNYLLKGIVRASALVSTVKIKILCHVIKLIIYFKSDIPK